MPSPRQDRMRQTRIETGRRALSLVAQGMPMNAVAAQLCADVGPFKETRSRTWLYSAMADADRIDKLCHNVTAQTDKICHAVAQDIDSDPLVQ